MHLNVLSALFFKAETFQQQKPKTEYCRIMFLYVSIILQYNNNVSL